MCGIILPKHADIRYVIVAKSKINDTLLNFLKCLKHLTKIIIIALRYNVKQGSPQVSASCKYSECGKFFVFPLPKIGFANILFNESYHNCARPVPKFALVGAVGLISRL